jgi:hypothetical protein
MREPLDDLPGLKEKVAAGLAAARAGNLIDGEAFFDELDSEEDVASSA